jgi:hypothetical protein
LNTEREKRARSEERGAGGKGKEGERGVVVVTVFLPVGVWGAWVVNCEPKAEIS